MGKAIKVKGDLISVLELVDLIGVLKDVADSKFHALMAQKARFARFGESFVEFFRMVSFSSVRHPLVTNDYPTTGIVAVTSDGSFMGDLNNKVIRAALKEKDNHKNSAFVAVGRKGADRLIPTFGKMKVFEEVDSIGLYETAILLKDFLVQEVMNKRMGKIVAVYPWPKDFNTQKPRVVKLLPCDDLVTKQEKMVDRIENVIEESDPLDIVGFLVDIWLSTRIYELLFDMSIAAAAAQAQRLETSSDKMKKEKKTVQLAYRKAKKGDIDSSLRETFSARMMTMKKKQHKG